MVLCGPMWSHVVPCGPVWSHVVPCGPMFSRMVQYGSIRSHMVLKRPAWSRLVPLFEIIILLDMLTLVQLTQLLHKFCACFIRYVHFDI